MSTRILLADSHAEAVVLPEFGGAIASYDLLVGGTRQALFRPAASGITDPFGMACNPLVPWSNRISGGGFRHAGRFYALAPNWPGEACPLHGNGFQSEWRVEYVRRERVDLALDSEGPGPFRYHAELRYWLAEGALGMRLAVVHRGTDSLPYGLGFHPWLMREELTVLQAAAEQVWLEDERHLPAGRLATRERAAWDFARPQKLPNEWINNAFVGWNGWATVAWPGRGLTLAIDASQADGLTSTLTTYVLYAPGEGAAFFCFEPVSHPVDAHNLPGSPAENGLFVLSQGESAAVQCRFLPCWS